jgi:hypothetical protein
MTQISGSHAGRCQPSGTTRRDGMVNSLGPRRADLEERKEVSAECELQDRQFESVQDQSTQESCDLGAPEFVLHHGVRRSSSRIDIQKSC